jgi:hypothetical protein
VSASQINLAWTDNSNNETGFTIERPTDGTNFSPVITVGANVTSYSDTGLAASTKYYYRVDATNAGDDSPDSNFSPVPAPWSVRLVRRSSESTVTLGWIPHVPNSRRGSLVGGLLSEL